MPGSARRTMAALAAVLVATLGLPLAAATAEDSAEPSVLRVGVPNDLTSANPLSLRSGSDWNVATTQYDMMWMFGNDDLSAQPGLAEGCESNEDKTEWTCTFRDDVLWSDGKPMTSRDVAFT
ncbi:MAG TPA: ABC transporter substrate-binding protein, partial [Actinomycetes bacterium]|nr:ABC transporter substrate-binding protein [Actinomycetes bacterium]